MRTWLVVGSVLLFILGSVPAIRSAPIGVQMIAPEQSLIPAQKKKGKGWGKGMGWGRKKGQAKGKGPDCFNRCLAKGKRGPGGCSAQCR